MISSSWSARMDAGLRGRCGGKDDDARRERGYKRKGSDKWSSLVHVLQINSTMLSAELQELFANNRRAERPQVHAEQLGTLLGEDQYTNLIASLVNVRKTFPKNHPSSQLYLSPPLSQYCQELGISSASTYLAKIYLDIVLAKSNFIEERKLLMISLCCVWIATKLNEPSQLSSYFSPDLICQHGQHQFSVQEVVDLQLELLEHLDYNLLYTTPYDYINPFFQTFPWMRKAKPVVGQLIDFSVTLPEVVHEGSQHIFYGSFLALCQIKEYQLTPLQQSIVWSQVTNRAKAEALRRRIVEAYKQIAASDEENLQKDCIQITTQ